MQDKLAKKVSVILTLFLFLIFVLNWISYRVYSEDIWKDVFNIILLFCILILFFSYFLSIRKYIQVIALGFLALISLYDTPKDTLSFGAIILTLILMYKYNFFEKKVILKVVLTFSTILVVLILGTLKEISIGMKTSNLGLADVLNDPLRNLVFFLVFLTMLILVMYDEIAVYVTREKKYKTEIKTLNSTIEKTQEYLSKIDANFIDPVQAGLTKKEMVLLESLCLYRESNIDLAQRLGKSPNTIKVQLTRIMNKIGAETRYQLIDLCRHYFIENRSEEKVEVTV